MFRLTILLSLTLFSLTSALINPFETASQLLSNLTAFPTFPEYVKALNYPVETHNIHTEDGYILTFFRIQAKGQKSLKKGLPVVYLQHGLLDSSDTWVINDEDNAPGLQLANKGYDVWLGNSRGNKYSLGHITLKTSDPEFWAFTFQNMSHYDLPAAFTYINKFTDQNISYVGHSQGTLIMFAALSERDPTVLKYFKNYIAFAPVAWVQYIKAGPVQLMAHSPLASIMVSLKMNQFFPSNFYQSDFSHYFCKLFNSACADILGFIFGADPDYDNYARYSTIVQFEPSGTSVTNMLHWRQLVLTGRFNKYDYGIKGNQLHYNQPYPPDYNVSNIDVPMNLFFGENDFLVDSRDTQTLLEALKGNTKVTYKTYDADHMTFLWSKDMSFYFDDLVKILEKQE